MKSEERSTMRDTDVRASHNSQLATRNSLWAYAQLVRLPAVFSAISNVAMGYLFVHPSLSPGHVFVLLVLSSVSLYWAGMILNDIYDYSRDLQQRPQRPLPSGRIPLQLASRLGWGLLTLGVAAGWAASCLGAAHPMRSGIVATLLAACIVLYDRVLKSTVVGPWAMGACRMLNVLLGMSTGEFFGSVATLSWTGYAFDQWCVAAGIGLFVAGLTWAARSETRADNRGEMLLGLALMFTAFLLLACFPFVGRYAEGRADLAVSPPSVWLMLLAPLAFSVLRPVVYAVGSPSPDRLQAAIQHGLLSLIVLDAAICLVVRQPFGWSLAVLALLVPSVILGRWLYLT